MPRKYSMTIEDHAKASVAARTLDANLSALMHEISGKVPVALVDRLIKIDRILWDVISGLEDVMFKEHKGHAGLTTDVYYPPSPNGDMKR